MKLYRLMKADFDGRPLVGNGSMILGIRPTDPTQPNKRADVAAVADTDTVTPGGGGLSCYTDPAAILIRGKALLLRSLDSSDLPVNLAVRADRDPHRLIEPATRMTLAEFQLLTAGTRQFWQLEPQGGP